MDAKGILITVVVIVVIFLIYKAFFGDSSLSSLEDAKKTQTISSSSLGSSESNSSANFTYSIWFYVDNWNYKYGVPKVVLAHGSDTSAKGGFGIVLGGMQNDLNIAVETYPDGISITGGNMTGGLIDAHGDHRVAMAFAMAALKASGTVVIKNAEGISTSFPTFFEVARSAGLRIK